VADSEDSDGRTEQQPGEQAGDGRGGPAGSLAVDWSDVVAIPCKDGVYRLIPHPESGIFPLAHGLPRGVVYSGDPCLPEYANSTQEARAQRLKGYGNAIVPQVGAEFIKAFLGLPEAGGDFRSLTPLDVDVVGWRTPAADESGITPSRLVTKEGEPFKGGERAYDKETGRLAQVGLNQEVSLVPVSGWPTPTCSDENASRSDNAREYSERWFSRENHGSQLAHTAQAFLEIPPAGSCEERPTKSENYSRIKEIVENEHRHHQDHRL
jgi:hypothetical protein